MNPANFRVRRATLDDLGQLSAMWQSLRLPVEDLARRITEFQIAESPEGNIIGALGFQIVEKQGRIHSESFSDFSFSEHARSMLWDRIHSVATNHGLLRLWTQENAPFWNHCGLAKPDAEALTKLPAPWRALAGDWLTLKLREDVETLVSLDKEFSLFMQSEKARTQRAFQQAKILKFIATAIVLVVCGVLLWGFIRVLRQNPRLLGRSPR